MRTKTNKKIDNITIFICEKCEGTGYLSDIILCDRCHGEGVLDWIEKIVGKDPDNYFAIDYEHGIGIYDERPDDPREGALYYDRNKKRFFIRNKGRWEPVG